jgi:hypothetical protein
MRISSSKPNVLRLYDNISGSELEIYYRRPTSAEQAKYTNGFTRRVRNKVINCTGENRLKWGKEILAGFRDGDFGYERDDGTVVPVSARKESEHYREDWKDWFCENNADLVATLAIHVFEDTAEKDTQADPAGEDSDPNA